MSECLEAVASRQPVLAMAATEVIANVDSDSAAFNNWTLLHATHLMFCGLSLPLIARLFGALVSICGGGVNVSRRCGLRLSATECLYSFVICLSSSFYLYLCAVR